MARLTLALTFAALVAGCLALPSNQNLRDLEEKLLGLLEKRGSGFARLNSAGASVVNAVQTEAGVEGSAATAALFELRTAAATALGETPSLVKFSTSKDAFELSAMGALGFRVLAAPASSNPKSEAAAGVIASESGKSAYIAIADANGSLTELSSGMTGTDKEAAKSRLTGVVAAAVAAKGKLGTGVTLADVHVKSANYDVYVYPASEHSDSSIAMILS